MLVGRRDVERQCDTSLVGVVDTACPWAMHSGIHLTNEGFFVDGCGGLDGQLHRNLVNDVARGIHLLEHDFNGVKRGAGSDVVAEDKNSIRHIDRKKLGKIVFDNTEKMNILENITHPRIVQQIKGMINNKQNDYIIEAIEIVSSGLVNICDELWVIHAEPEQQIKRLIENRHLSYEEACSRLKAQENHDWDEKKADRVIYSTEPMESMERQVLDALDQIYRLKK